MRAVGRVTALAAALVSALLPTATAQGMNANTVASYLALGIIVGSLFFGYLGLYDKNFFLVLGNLCCVAGAIVFIMMIMDMDGNPNWALGFAALAVWNVYSFLVGVNKYRVEGCDDSDDESEPESEDDETWRPPEITDGPGTPAIEDRPGGGGGARKRTAKRGKKR